MTPDKERCMQEGPPAETLAQATERVQKTVGKRRLTDDEVVLLACAELARTYTRDEKGYR